MIITHKLEMDMTEQGTVQRIDVVQGDSNTRALELTLLSGGKAWAIPENAVVRMRYCKSDGTKGIYDTLPDGTAAWSRKENTVTMILAPQMLTAAGMVLAQLELVQGTATLATFTIQIGVERNPAAGVLKSEDYINWLQWMEEELDRLLTVAKESGEFDGPQGEQGPQGLSGPGVFEYAAEAGYTGTEDEFKEMLITHHLPLEGGTMLGAVDMNGQTLSGLTTPSADTDAATKNYVDMKQRVNFITLRASAWTSAVPYTQNFSITGVLPTDHVLLQPAYTGVRNTDLEIKSAFECITYSYAQNKYITVVCLESKPDIDMTLMVVLLR